MWDSTAELVVLAQQSSPADEGLLDNTCAGVRTIRTMGRIVTVHNSSSSTVGAGTEELQLDFRKAWDSVRKGAVVEVDKEYGAMNP